MAQKSKSVQIRLREQVPIERAIIKYLSVVGERTGLEKQVFVTAMREYMKEHPIDEFDLDIEVSDARTSTSSSSNKSEQEISNSSTYSYASLQDPDIASKTPKTPSIQDVKLDGLVLGGLSKG